MGWRRWSRHNLFWNCASDVSQHPEDVLFDMSNRGFDLLKPSRGSVAVKVAIEVDLVADQTHFLVPGISLVCIDPGFRHVRLNLAVKERVHVLAERRAFAVA